MSKILGIVAEYNPFHDGHLFHLNQSKKITNCDFTICVMSGNFIQRGESAILDKWARTKMALNNGIDLVVELPVIYAISSAENFSYGAVKILDSLNVDYISFGSESGEIAPLEEIAEILNNEPEQYLQLLNKELDKGISYPKARENAINLYCRGGCPQPPGHLWADAPMYLSHPNNILGIEYLKALKKLNSKIIPMTIKRSFEYRSATELRAMMNENDCPKTFEKEIFYVLKKMDVSEIGNLPDVTEGLEFKIKKALLSSLTLQELISNIKSKRYTRDQD